MSYFMIDVESDGPCPGLYSMVSLGAIRVERDLKNAPTFYGEYAPISNIWVPEALAISRISRKEHLGFDNPARTTLKFAAWIERNSEGRPIFISDNNGFDWQFVNYYFWKYMEYNPFGFSSRNLGDLYKGMQKTTRANFKHLRKTKHTHSPLDDARGNAEALSEMVSMGLQI